MLNYHLLFLTLSVLVYTVHPPVSSGNLLCQLSSSCILFILFEVFFPGFFLLSMLVFNVADTGTWLDKFSALWS